MSTRGHRVLWTILGTALTLLGGAGIAASFGVLPGVAPSTPLLWTGLLTWWRGLSDWAPLVTIGVGLLIALLGAGLLRSQLPHAEPAADDLTVYDGGNGGDGSGDGWGSGPGRTVIRAGVLADGLERDLMRDPRIRDADVALSGTGPAPRVHITLKLVDGAVPRSVQHHVRAAVDRFRGTSGIHPDRVDILVNLATPAPARVG